ncbi:MAG: fasciclin domain-containing protein [Chloroflexota bacterium]|nr:fasciclin domain-containing protein [Chloroflexota bacterium]
MDTDRTAQEQKRAETALSIMDMLSAAGTFARLTTAIRAAGLEEDLRAGGSLTIFAPTDQAFDKLPEGTLERLLQDRAQLAEILQYHLVGGGRTLGELIKQHSVKTLQGRSVTALDDGGTPRINNARIEQADGIAANGLIHQIDTVLLPIAPAEPKPLVDRAAWEDWIPYIASQPLPIGDAELVPADPRVRAGAEQLKDVLTKYNVKINMARTVRLTERGETTYRAPRGPDKLAEKSFLDRARDGLVIGMLVIEGDTKLSSGPGAYIEFVRMEKDGRWYVYLLDGKENKATYSEAAVRNFTDHVSVPIASISYGTKKCTHRQDEGEVCERCHWWELVPWVPACGEE